MNLRYITFVCLFVGLLVLSHFSGSALPQTAQASGTIRFSCTASHLLVSSGGMTLFTIAHHHLPMPLQTAILSGHHQLIASANGASLWALRSNELQAHWDYDPDGTKVIVGANICNPAVNPPGLRLSCIYHGLRASTSWGTRLMDVSFEQLAGPLYTAILSGENQFVAASGGASLWALKSNQFQLHWDSDPDATKLVIDATRCGVIPAQIITAPPHMYTTTTAAHPTYPTGTSTTYVVQRGDNLYRISLRFGRTMSQIARANGITNYNLIYAGQRLVIP